MILKQQQQQQHQQRQQAIEQAIKQDDNYLQLNKWMKKLKIMTIPHLLK